MLGIPFLTRDTRRKKSSDSTPAVMPDMKALLCRAETAIRDNNPSKALSLTIPYQKREDAPDRVRLVAAKALCAMGRYPETRKLMDAALLAITYDILL